MQVTIPPSLTMKSSSSSSSIDGLFGAPRGAFQATWVDVTSPLPSGRTAKICAVLKPVG